MSGLIDVRDLPEEDARLLRELADLLRRRAEVSKKKTKGKFRGVVLGTHRSDVIGGLTRGEIYDHL